MSTVITPEHVRSALVSHGRIAVYPDRVEAGPVQQDDDYHALAVVSHDDLVDMLDALGTLEDVADAIL